MPQVNTLQKEIPGAQLKQVTGLNGSTISLVLGSGFKGVSTHKATQKAQGEERVGGGAEQALRRGQRKREHLPPVRGLHRPGQPHDVRQLIGVQLFTTWHTWQQAEPGLRAALPADTVARLRPGGRLRRRPPRRPAAADRRALPGASAGSARGAGPRCGRDRPRHPLRGRAARRRGRHRLHGGRCPRRLRPADRRTGRLGDDPGTRPGPGPRERQGGHTSADCGARRTTPSW